MAVASPRCVCFISEHEDGTATRDELHSIVENGSADGVYCAADCFMAARAFPPYNPAVPISELDIPLRPPI